MGRQDGRGDRVEGEEPRRAGDGPSAQRGPNVLYHQLQRQEREGASKLTVSPACIIDEGLAAILQLYDSKTLDVIKTYQDPQTPLNSAALIPGQPYILIGGGQEAMSVTTTGARQGHFEVRMWHKVFEEEVSRIKGGFGPCNSIAVHPEGKGYAIGGEDGYVRLHHFDDDVFRFKPFGKETDPVED